MTGAISNLHPDLIAVLTQLEQRLGFELHLTSGFREKAHNLTVGGVPNSEHTYTPAKGADVRCLSSAIRYKLVRELFAMGVRRIGIGDTFIHVGVAQDKPQDVVWAYYEKASLPQPVTKEV